MDPACLGAGTVEALGGAARIEAEYGVTVDEPSTDDVALSPADAARVVDVYRGCGDLVDVFVNGLTSEGSPTPDELQCLRDGLDADEITAVFAESLQGIEDGPASDVLFDRVVALITICEDG